MNRFLLAQLQGPTVYPSITVLMNTTPGTVLSPTELATALRLVKHADDRLTGDVPDELRGALISTITRLVDDQTTERSARALAVCVSPDYSAVVHLGRTVNERVVIDDTFATRDLVADLNRTACYRVLTISDRRTRLFIGDRQGLIESRTGTWPVVRQDEQSAASWKREVEECVRAEHTQDPLPTIIAGVERTVRRTIIANRLDTIGFIPGNHDRTSWIELHNAAWPLVTDWLRTDHSRATKALEHARSTRRYAGGIDEIWPLANDGRVGLLVVEDTYALPARIDHNLQLQRADDREAPDVIDDIIDDTIEVVLRHGGNAVIVADNHLRNHDRIAAVLRY